MWNKKKEEKERDGKNTMVVQCTPELDRMRKGVSDEKKKVKEVSGVASTLKNVIFIFFHDTTHGHEENTGYSIKKRHGLVISTPKLGLDPSPSSHG